MVYMKPAWVYVWRTADNRITEPNPNIDGQEIDVVLDRKINLLLPQPSSVTAVSFLIPRETAVALRIVFFY